MPSIKTLPRLKVKVLHLAKGLYNNPQRQIQGWCSMRIELPTAVKASKPDERDCVNIEFVDENNEKTKLMVGL